MENNDFNRNPKGNNQWVLRSDDVIQKIINKYPTWTKKDFTGEGKLNPNKKDALLTKTECEREKLVFGHVGKRRRPLKEIYKLSTKENISKFENKEIDEDTIRHLRSELGDICWYMAQACMALDTSFEEIIDINVAKLSDRYPGGFDALRSASRKEGDI